MADTSVKVSFIGDAKKLKSTIDSVDKEIDGLGNKSRSFGTKFTDGFSKALPVLAGVGAGVAVLGTALKAAVEDEAEQKTLAETLRNVAGATNEQIAATEKWIDTTQRATGVADSELRPALALLTRQTGDTTKAQGLLGLAMDVSQGTGKDLNTVAAAMVKILEGNTGAASKLVPELTGIAREGASAEEMMAALGTTFGGQTAANAETAEGKMKRLNISFDEMKEKLGEKLMPVFLDFSTWLIEKGIPKIEEVATKVSDWWAKQEDLKVVLKESYDFVILLAEGVGYYIEKIKDLYNWLDQGGGGVGIFGEIRGYAPAVTVRGETISPDTYGGGRASGGPVMPGMSYKVNERGSEWLQMGNRGGWITPNGGSGGGGQTIIFEMNGREIARALIDEGDKSGGLPIRIRAAS